MKKRLRPHMIAVLVLACAVATAQAATWDTSGSGTGNVAVKDSPHPLAPQQITQNVEPNTLVQFTSVACGSAGVQTENAWWRLFDLDDGHGLIHDFCAVDVDYGIESSVGPINTDVYIYCLDEGLPFLVQFLTLVGEAHQNQPDASLEFFNIPLPNDSACCDAETQEMAVSIGNDEDCSMTGNCQTYFIGCNNLGQTAPTYLASESCGIIDPVTTDAIGFPEAQVVMVVNGIDNGLPDDGGGGGDDGGGGGVPATTKWGVIILIAVFLGITLFFMRRRAKA